jgi:MFS family permease
MPRIQTLDALLAFRDFRFLWTANFCSNTAHWLQLLTLGWLVRHLSLDMEQSALLVVGIGGTASLPSVILGPWGGVLGDRLDRRRLAMFLELAMCCLAMSFACLVWFDVVDVWHVYVYAFVAGCCESMKMPVRHALIANTVPADSLSNAFTTSVLTIPGTRMIGPFIGGLLVTSFGFFWNFTIEALLYFAVFLSLLPMKTPFTGTRNTSDSSGPKAIFKDLIDGIKYLWNKQRVLALLVFLSSGPNIVCHPLLFLLPVYISEVLGKGADYGGYMLSLNGVGGFLMVLTVSAFGFPKRRGLLCILAALTSAILTLLMGLSMWLVMAFIVVTLFGASQTLYRTTNGVLMQTLVDDGYRVRINGIYQMGMGMVIFVSLFVGWVAGQISVNFVLAAMGVLAALICLSFLLGSKVVRNQP